MEESLSTSEEWALEIIVGQVKAELTELLKNRSCDEVKQILAARRAGREATRNP